MPDRVGGLVLSSRTDLDHPGDYLAYVDRESGRLAVLTVPGFSEEELEVYRDRGRLRAEHAFWLFGLPFLTLRYRIRPRASVQPGHDEGVTGSAGRTPGRS